MGYTKKKINSTALEKILDNCDNLRQSLQRLGINNGFSGLSGGFLKSIEVKSDNELELTCRRTLDKKDVVVNIQAVLDKFGKVHLTVTKTYPSILS